MPAQPRNATLDRDAVIDRLQSAGCVFAAEEADLLLAAAPTDLAAVVDRRVHGEPLEHILGWAEFCGHRVAVDPGVFVPRRRSELLARRAIAIAAPGMTVVDMCCGSGAVGLSIALALEPIELYAVDLDPAAVACAAKNLAPVCGQVHLGDLDAPLPPKLAGEVGLLVANAPYVPANEIRLMPAEARDHDPRVALDGGDDGVQLHRRIADLAPRWLRPDGALLIETSSRQAGLTAAAVRHAGMTAEVETDPERDATVVIGRLRPVDGRS